jgi:hypothetical protein
MSNLQSLIEKLSEFQRRYAKIKSELSAIDRLVDGDDIPNPGVKVPPIGDDLPAPADEGLKQVVRYLRDAGRPLPVAEIALGLSLSNKVTERRLAMAMKLGFIQRAGYGVYQVVDTVAEM